LLVSLFREDEFICDWDDARWFVNQFPSSHSFKLVEFGLNGLFPFWPLWGFLHQENPSFAFRAFSCFFVLFRAFYQKNRKSTKKPSPLLARLLSELVKKANPFPKAL